MNKTNGIYAFGVLVVLLLSIFAVGNYVGADVGMDMTETEVEGMELSAFVLGTGNNTSVVKNHVPTVIGGVCSEEGIHALDVNITDVEGEILYEWNVTTDWSCHWYQKIVFDLPIGKYWLNVTYALNISVYDTYQFWVANNESGIHTYLEMSYETNSLNISYEYLISDEHWGFFESGGAVVNFTIWTYENYTLAQKIVAWTEEYTLDDYGVVRGWILLDDLEPCHQYITTITMSGYSPDILIDADNGFADAFGDYPRYQDSSDFNEGEFINFFESENGNLSSAEFPLKYILEYVDMNGDGAYTVVNKTNEPLRVQMEIWDTDHWDTNVMPFVYDDSFGDPDQYFWDSLYNASNSGSVYFNDSYELIKDDHWTSFLASEDLWLDNGNGVWDIEGEASVFWTEHHTIHYVPPAQQQYTYELQHRWNLRTNPYDEAVNVSVWFDASENVTSISFKDADGDWQSIVREKDDEGNWTYFGDYFEVPAGYGVFVYCEAEDGIDLQFQYQYEHEVTNGEVKMVKKVP